MSKSNNDKNRKLTEDKRTPKFKPVKVVLCFKCKGKSTDCSLCDGTGVLQRHTLLK